MNTLRHQQTATQTPVNHQSPTSQPPVMHHATTSHTPVNNQLPSITLFACLSLDTSAPVNHQPNASQTPVCASQSVCGAVLARWIRQAYQLGSDCDRHLSWPHAELCRQKRRAL
eukprot:1044872-Alexandrium_andersonii.AAC.1